MDNFNLPQEKLHTLIKELTPLLNRLNIDNELDTQDFLLAEMITEQINSMVVARRKSKKLSGKDRETATLENYPLDTSSKESILYKIKSSLKITHGMFFTKEIEEIYDSLFEAILDSELNTTQVINLINHVYRRFNSSTGNIIHATRVVLFEASSYCENFSFSEREKIQEKIRELIDKLE